MNKRPLDPKDIFSFRSFGDARVSPSGGHIVFVGQHHNLEKEKSTTDLYLYDTRTEKTRKLTNSGKDRSPRWSPDGKKLAFTSDRSGRSQLWTIDPFGGEAWRIPTKETVQGGIAFSPDGGRLYFTSSKFSKPDDWTPYPGAPEGDKARALEQAERAAKPKDEKKETQENKPNDIKVVTRFRYRMDGVGYYGDMRRQVYWVDVPSEPEPDTGQSATQLTQGDWDHDLPTPTPDGRYAILSALRREGSDFYSKSDIWVFESESGKPTLLYDAPGPCYGPQVSPDGQYLAFFGHDMERNVSTRTDLYILPIGSFLGSLAEGEAPKPLSLEHAKNVTAHLDRAAGSGSGAEPRYGGANNFVWQGDTAYFLLQDHGETFLWKAEPGSDGEWSATQVFGTPGRGLGAFHVKNEIFAYQASTPMTPEDLFVWKDGKETRITKENDGFVSSLALGKSEKFQYASKDGQELDGWLLYPYGYQAGKQYPLVVQVHGGPHSSFSSAFMFQAQMFAGRGYAVAYCNPRGSTSYGQDFTAVIDGDWGQKDYEDVVALADELVRRGVADKDNMFIHGWSYGGYMTTWVVTQTDRFRAACAGASVTNLHSGYGTEDITLADEHEYGGRPWEVAELLLRQSPLTHVANVRTPILLLHGEGDLRCPISHSEQFYIALRRLGKPVVMVRYPGEFHGLRRHLHRVDRYERTIAWFEHHRTDRREK